ncbi:MAG: S24 family peptidase [Gallionellaceae bacterium]|nr:S24 family peptidase [Gallionellaceae bacterium]MDD5364572.1 S24 family peptidase [Gallionellaceae bacterium]
MTEKKPFPIPVRPAQENIEDDLVASACSGGEPYALMVLGDSMLPEFEEGWVVVVEPEGLAKDGSYVVAWANEEYIFRQLVKHDDGWMLKPLNPLYPNIPIADDLSAVKGVVVMKKKPGRRRESKSYV